MDGVSKQLSELISKYLFDSTVTIDSIDSKVKNAIKENNYTLYLKLEKGEEISSTDIKSLKFLAQSIEKDELKTEKEETVNKTSELLNQVTNALGMSVDDFKTYAQGLDLDPEELAQEALKLLSGNTQNTEAVGTDNNTENQQDSLQNQTSDTSASSESTQETSSIDSLIQQAQDGIAVDYLFDELYSLDEVKNTINADGSELSDEQKAQLYENLKENYKKTEFNSDDFIQILNDIENGTYTPALTTVDAISSADSDVTDTSNLIATPENTTSTGKTGSSGGGGSKGSTGVDSTIGGDTSAQTTGETKEEIQQQLTTAQSELSSNQDKLEEEKNSQTVQTAQTDLEESYNTYQEALAKVDEEQAQKLSELNSAIIEKENAVTSETEQKLTYENTISSLQTQISSYNASITSYSNGISSLESSINSLDSTAEDYASRKSALESKKSTLETKKKETEAKLKTANKDLETTQNLLNQVTEQLATDEQDLATTKTKLTELESQIAQDHPELKELQAAYEEKEKAFEEAKETQLTNITTLESSVKDSQAKVDELQTKLDKIEASATVKENSDNSLSNPEALYKTLDLEAQGMSYEVFQTAIEGYNNLDDSYKTSGYLAIFDTSQSADKERYYLINLNTMEIEAKSVMKEGSNQSASVTGANEYNSHSTLYGFQQFSEEYYSSSMGKRAIRIDGLEEGINDNSRGKGTVLHYTKVNQNTTWGCLGFPPVVKNGKIDKEATYEEMRKLGPSGAVLFTYTDKEEYKEKSELV